MRQIEMKAQIAKIIREYSELSLANLVAFSLQTREDAEIFHRAICDFISRADPEESPYHQAVSLQAFIYTEKRELFDGGFSFSRRLQGIYGDSQGLSKMLEVDTTNLEFALRTGELTAPQSHEIYQTWMNDLRRAKPIPLLSESAIVAFKSFAQLVAAETSIVGAGKGIERSILYAVDKEFRHAKLGLRGIDVAYAAYQALMRAQGRDAQLLPIASIPDEITSLQFVPAATEIVYKPYADEDPEEAFCNDFSAFLMVLSAAEPDGSNVKHNTRMIVQQVDAIRVAISLARELRKENVIRVNRDLADALSSSLSGSTTLGFKVSSRGLLVSIDDRGRQGDGKFTTDLSYLFARYTNRTNSLTHRDMPDKIRVGVRPPPEQLQALARDPEPFSPRGTTYRRARVQVSVDTASLSCKLSKMFGREVRVLDKNRADLTSFAATKAEVNAFWALRSSAENSTLTVASVPYVVDPLNHKDRTTFTHQLWRLSAAIRARNTHFAQKEGWQIDTTHDGVRIDGASIDDATRARVADWFDRPVTALERGL